MERGQYHGLSSLAIAPPAAQTLLTAETDGTVGQRDPADFLDRANHTGTQAISTVSGLQAALDAKEETANKGQANGYCDLDGGGKVPAARLPSYVDDVEEYADFASLPATGETGKIYVTIDTGKIYRWSGSAYVEISPSPGSTDDVPEGATNLYHTTARARTAAVVDSLAGSQTDQAPSVSSVNTALNGKAAATHAGQHKAGGGDAIKLDELAAPDDNTTLNVSTTAHGLCPKLPGTTTDFLRGDGTWAEPAGGGGGSGDVTGPASSTDSAVARFDGTTGKVIKNSSVTVDDSGNTTSPANRGHFFGSTSYGVEQQFSDRVRLRANAVDLTVRNNGELTIAGGAATLKTLNASTAPGGMTFTAGSRVSGTGAGGSVTLQSGDSGGTDQAGAITTIAGGRSTGSSAGGAVRIRVSPAGASGSSVNALADVMQLSSDLLTRCFGNLQVDGDAAITGNITAANLGTASAEDVGTAIGDVVQLENVGGSPGLPAVDGSQLLNLPGGSLSDGDKGDITVSGGGTVWTIDNDAVTYAKMQNVSATDRLLGRQTAGAGDVEEIPCTAAGRALLDDADAAAQRTTLGLGTSATNDNAVTSDVNAGTSTTLTVTPNALAASNIGTKVISVDVVDYTDAPTIGDGKRYLVVPIELDGWKLVSVGAHVFTAASSGTTTVMIANATDAVDMLTTAITIDASEKDSATAATPPVIDSVNNTVNVGDEIRVDVDGVGSGAQGLQVRLGFRK